MLWFFTNNGNFRCISGNEWLIESWDKIVNREIICVIGIVKQTKLKCNKIQVKQIAYQMFIAIVLFGHHQHSTGGIQHQGFGLQDVSCQREWFD